MKCRVSFLVDGDKITVDRVIRRMLDKAGIDDIDFYIDGDGSVVNKIWRSPDGAAMINLDHVQTVDRPTASVFLRINMHSNVSVDLKTAENADSFIAAFMEYGRRSL